jgi:tripeptidyl-peptidase-1
MGVWVTTQLFSAHRIPASKSLIQLSPNSSARTQDVLVLTVLNSCPYVTTVGATKVLPGRTVFEPESVASDPGPFPFAGGGGFSNVYPAPNYQKSAVER